MIPKPKDKAITLNLQVAIRPIRIALRPVFGGLRQFYERAVNLASIASGAHPISGFFN